MSVRVWLPLVGVRGCSVSGGDVIDTTPAHRAEVFATYHARAAAYERALSRVLAGGSDEDRAVMEWARIALYDAEREALRVA